VEVVYDDALYKSNVYFNYATVKNAKGRATIRLGIFALAVNILVVSKS